MENSVWVLCPVCGNKTRDRIRIDTILINYPLYCPKCKQETLINAKDLNIMVIKERSEKSLYELKGALLYSLSRVVRPAELHSRSAEENCSTEHVSSLRSVKVATPPCAAYAAIPCGLAVCKQHKMLFAASK